MRDPGFFMHFCSKIPKNASTIAWLGRLAETELKHSHILSVNRSSPNFEYLVCSSAEVNSQVVHTPVCCCYNLSIHFCFSS